MRQFIVMVRTRVFPANTHPAENAGCLKFLNLLDSFRSSEASFALPLFAYVQAVTPHADLLEKDVDRFMTSAAPHIAGIKDLGVAQHWQSFSVATREPIALFIHALYKAGVQIKQRTENASKSETVAAPTTPATASGGLATFETILDGIDFDEVLPEVLAAIRPSDMRLVMGAMKQGGRKPSEADVKGIIARVMSTPALRAVLTKLSKSNDASNGGLKGIINGIPDADLDRVIADLFKSPMLSIALNAMPEVSDQLVSLRAADLKRMLADIPDGAVDTVLGAASTGDVDTFVDVVDRQARAHGAKK